MIEYINKDVKEIGDALSTLIQKCAKAGGNELKCTISYDDDLELDCYFIFKVHEEDEHDYILIRIHPWNHIRNGWSCMCSDHVRQVPLRQIERRMVC